MENPSISEKFKTTACKLEGKLAIFATAVDPDAIASALALKLLIEHMNANIEEVAIFYGGEIGHPQSRAMFQRYNLADHIMPARKFIKEHYQHIALVDSSSVNDARCEEIANLEPIIVIDHHNEPSIPKSEDMFVWIEPVSATATLITELMKELDVRPATQIRALLCLAIYTDTKKLAKCDLRGIQAIAWLMEKDGTSDAFGSLVEYTLPRSYFLQDQLALNNAVQKDGWLVTNLGYIGSQDGDNIATIADEMARQEAITFVVVWAIVDEKYVRISVRSNDVSVPIGNILKRFGESGGFKTTSNGKGEGGAKMNLETFSPWFMPETKEATLNLIKEAIETMVFK